MSRSTLPALPCICASFRRAARALTQRYEQAFRPLGLRAPQFTTLQVLARAGELSQSQLADILAIDVTTLTRTLDIMRRRGWIAERPGKDRRRHFWRLAPKGRTQLRRAEPAWEKLQAQLRGQIGQPTWNRLLELTTQVAAGIDRKGEQS